MQITISCDFQLFRVITNNLIQIKLFQVKGGAHNILHQPKICEGGALSNSAHHLKARIRFVPPYNMMKVVRNVISGWWRIDGGICNPADYILHVFSRSYQMVMLLSFQLFSTPQRIGQFEYLNRQKKPFLLFFIPKACPMTQCKLSSTLNAVIFTSANLYIRKIIACKSYKYQRSGRCENGNIGDKYRGRSSSVLHRISIRKSIMSNE